MLVRPTQPLARLALATTLVSLVGVSHADQKFTHSADVKPNVTLTDRSRPKATKETQAAPTATATQLLDLAGLQGPIEAEKIALLEDLYKKTPKQDVIERADYLYRLATIHAKRNRFHRLRATEADIKKQKTEHAKHAKLAKDTLIEAIKKYKVLVDDPDFANVPLISDAIFYYAYTLQHANYLKEAREAYDKLLKNYPKSKYIPEAHLAFAEYHFEARQLADAEARYRMVMKFPRSSVYRYAQYKLGWVSYNLGKFTEAMQSFNDVAQATRTDAGKAVLHRASKQDFVRAYAEIGKADKALPMFKRVGGGDGLDMLAALADIYNDQGKHDRAIYIYRQLMVEKPTDKNVCYWQHSIAKAMLAFGTGEDKIREIEQLAKLYNGVKTRLPKAEQVECRDSAAEMSGQLARAFHQEAYKTKSRELAGFARRLYRAYLGAFADAADYSETLYYHAELSWLYAEWETNQRLAVQRWQDAADAFVDAIERGKLSPALIQTSADAAMLARMKSLQVDPAVKKAAIDEDAAYMKIPTPRPLGVNETKLLAAYDLYLKYVKNPNDSERIDVMFHKAALLRRFDHLAKANEIFEAIATKHATHAAAEPAAQIVFDNYNRLQRYDQMFAFIDKLGKPWLADHPDVEKVIAKLRKQRVRKEAEALEAEAKQTGSLAKYVECGEKYLAAYNGDPLAEDAEVVIYNAGVCYELGKSLSAAMTAYRTLQEYFPKGNLTKKSIARLGNVYASVAYYREAAEKYEEYAKRFGGMEDAFPVLSNAVQFRKGVGDDKEAIADTMTFIKMFGAKQPAAAANAFFSMTGIYEKQGDLDKLARHLRAYLDKYGAVGGRDRKIIANAKLGQALWQSACPIPLVDGSCMRMERKAAFGRRSISNRRAATGVPKRCGEETIAELTMVSRDERKVKLAMAAFDAAIADYEKAAPTTGDTRGALYHYALSRFGKAERAYETYLGLPIPGNLDFDPRKAAVAAQSQKRFGTWFQAKLAQGVQMRKTYESIMGLKDGAIAIAAAARTGSILQNFSAQLFRAEIPANVRRGPFAEDASLEYCDTLAKVAEPLSIDAEGFYEGCLNTSTKLGWFSEWSRTCERELGQLKPGTYPQVFELRRSPDAYATITDTEGAPKL